MVLESLLNPKKAQDNPLELFCVSAVYTIVAVIFSLTIFPGEASILSVAFLTIIFVPFFQKLFEIEEAKEDEAAARRRKDSLFVRHNKLIRAFSVFFLGIVIAMSFLFIFYPRAQPAFDLQTQTLHSLAGTGQATGSGEFMVYFVNNTQVMVLMFVLSVAFGAGAVFILAWNASVIAVYAGLIMRSFVESGLSSGVAYLYGVPVALSSIALHGIPEIVAYFVAGLAGGILSVGIIREKAGSKEFNKIAIDACILFAAAEGLIIAAAVIEAFV